ncbi:MAG: hypothetical protein NWF07_10620 [Candidatus Bathyarchaeota archaeon]|nr:hypothetical protein [Candidatus Bathyarchaeota archaeon]
MSRLLRPPLKLVFLLQTAFITNMNLMFTCEKHRHFDGNANMFAGRMVEVSTGKFLSAWAGQFDRLARAERTRLYGECVDEVTFKMLIDDLVNAGALRRAAVKSVDVPPQLVLGETSPIVTPVSWSTSKLVLASSMQAATGFSGVCRFRPQIARYEMDDIYATVARKAGFMNTMLFTFIEGWLLYAYDLSRVRDNKDILIALVRLWNHGRPSSVSFNAVALLSTWMRIAGDVFSAWLPGKPYDTPRPSYEMDIDDFGTPLRPQALLDVLETGLDIAQGSIDNLGHLWNSPMAETLKSMYIVIFACYVNTEEGRDHSAVTREEIDRLRKAASSKSWYFTDNPMEFLVRCALFVARAVVMSAKTKSWVGLIGDDTGISTWALEANRLTSLATNNAHLSFLFPHHIFYVVHYMSSTLGNCWREGTD